jgi:hypothetical protein
MNRRWFLGRMGIGVAAAPALARQVEADMLASNVDGGGAGMTGGPVPTGGLAPSPPTSPLLKLLQSEANERSSRNWRRARIRKRALMAMHSWSPAFLETQIMDQAVEDEDALQKLWDKIEEVREGLGK